MTDNWLDRLEADVIQIRTKARNWRSFLENNKDLHGFIGVLWMNMGNVESSCEAALRRIEDAKSKDKETING
mgnify:CR=1 FL=1